MIEWTVRDFTNVANLGDPNPNAEPEHIIPSQDSKETKFHRLKTFLIIKFDINEEKKSIYILCCVIVMRKE